MPRSRSRPAAQCKSRASSSASPDFMGPQYLQGCVLRTAANSGRRPAPPQVAAFHHPLRELPRHVVGRYSPGPPQRFPPGEPCAVGPVRRAPGRSLRAYPCARRPQLASPRHAAGPLLPRPQVAASHHPLRELPRHVVGRYPPGPPQRFPPGEPCAVGPVRRAPGRSLRAYPCARRPQLASPRHAEGPLLPRPQVAASHHPLHQLPRHVVGRYPPGPPHRFPPGEPCAVGPVRRASGRPLRAYPCARRPRVASPRHAAGPLLPRPQVAASHHPLHQLPRHVVGRYPPLRVASPRHAAGPLLPRPQVAASHHPLHQLPRHVVGRYPPLRVASPRHAAGPLLPRPQVAASHHPLHQLPRHVVGRYPPLRVASPRHAAGPLLPRPQVIP